MERECPTHPGTDVPRFGAGDPQAFLAASAAEQALGLQLADGLANRGAVDAELTREIAFGGQRDRLSAASARGFAARSRSRSGGRPDDRPAARIDPSPGLPEQLAADQHAADFAGAGADLVELGVAQQPPGRIIVDVAVAAEQLDGVERASQVAALGAKRMRAGGILAGRLAAVAGAARPYRRRPRQAFSAAYMSASLPWISWKRADRLAELRAFVHVGDDEIEAGLHDAERARRRAPRARNRGRDIRTLTPWPTSPSTFSAGTSQSSNTSSLVSEPRMPSLSSFWPVRKPLNPLSMIKAVMPRAPASRIGLGIDHQRRRPSGPLVIHIFRPLST